MAISVDELATKAMALSSQARAILVEKIVESLDQEAVREIWLIEAKRRRDEIREGRVNAIPADEVMKSVRNLLGES
jgi:putative addiction module component (TIGR02574 family)